MLRRSAIQYQNKQIIIVDQTYLPHKIKHLKLTDYEAVIQAIKELKIRGAPLLGVAAAYTLAMEAHRKKKSLRNYLRQVAQQLKSARPTAVNLSWAADQMLTFINDNNISETHLKTVLTRHAQDIEKQEQNNSYAIGKIGAQLIKNNFNIMTICNTGYLAGPGIGTALGIIYTAHAQGKKIKVYVLETRPLLQGARLNVFELNQARIPYVLISDNMIATVMQDIDIVLIGADRIARNGDTANKIGSLTLAITAHYYHVAFYVAAPSSTIDLTKSSGQDITIEQRSAKEILYLAKQLITLKNAVVYNPAFDITPHQLIRGIITEHGIAEPPYTKSLVKINKAHNVE